MHLWQQEDYQKRIKEYLSLLDLGFDDLSIEEEEVNIAEFPEELQQLVHQSLSDQLQGMTNVSIYTRHTFLTKNPEHNKSIAWPMEERESEGTKKAIHLSGPIVHALTVGGVLIIDEIEAKMHPLLTLNIIQLFLSPSSNPLKAQLLFASHDTNLLQYSSLRRDQIIFVEKNREQATEVYSLSEFKYPNDKTERSDVNKEIRYLEGRYGAIPMLGAFREQIEKWYGQR